VRTRSRQQEVDGRWIAEVPELPGILAYGSSSADAISKAEVLALRVIADQLENGEAETVSIQFSVHSLHEELAVNQSQESFAAVQTIGWRVKCQAGSHKTLEREGYLDYVFAFHDSAEIGPRLLARVAKYTGLELGDL
jgi:predicted RNase H-like HicB family nuclease/predicted RNA binding protein YcfA (HicA-like mRNA interferase family)